MIIPAGTETNAEYHASGAWGSTRISDFLKSPLIALLKHTGQLKDERSTALTIGSALHARFDGGYAAEYITGPAVSSRRTKAWSEAVAAHPDQTVLLPSEVAMIDAMEASITRNPYAQCLLDGAEHEVGIRRESPHGDYQVQCRVDVWRPSALMADLKTTANIDDWAKSVVTYGYHRQAAFYRWLVEQETGERLPFTFVVVEKQAPYRCRVIDLDETYLALGWQEVEAALIGIGRCYASKQWEDPGYQHLTAPDWLARRLEPDHELAVETAHAG